MKLGGNDEVVLLAEAVALPGKRDELRRAFDELIPKTLAEPGVSAFVLHEDRDQAGHFMLYERYLDFDAVEKHFASDHFAVISDALAALAIDGKPMLTYYSAFGD
jgi:quinol monooxygenase YgiN